MMYYLEVIGLEYLKIVYKKPSHFCKGFTLLGVYQLFKVIKVFHYSSKEKIKFSWKKNLIRPGQGEIHTIDSFNIKLNSAIENLFACCILVVIFFQTSLSEKIGNIVERLFKLLFD